MDLPVFIFSATACFASLILLFIPLRRDVYNRHSQRYTLSGKWFILLALVAIFSGLVSLFLQFTENFSTGKVNPSDKETISRQLDSLQKVSLQKMDSIRQQVSLQLAESRKKIIDSLNGRSRSDSLATVSRDTLHRKSVDTLNAKKYKAALKNMGELSEDEKNLLLNSVERAKQRYHIKTQCIEVAVNKGSNPGKFVPHLQQFLKKKGYEVKDRKGGLAINFFYGVIITGLNGNCISIKIGSLAKSPVIFRVQ